MTVTELIEQLKTLDQELEVGYIDDDSKTWCEFDGLSVREVVRGFDPDMFEYYEKVVVLED